MGNQNAKCNLMDVIQQKDDHSMIQFTNEFINQILPEYDFYNLMQTHDIRKILSKKLGQFEIFLGLIIYNLSEYSKKNKLQDLEKIYLINNIRVLIRVLPILFEIEYQNFAEEFFWDKLTISRDKKTKEQVNGISLLNSIESLFFATGFCIEYPNLPWENLSKSKSANNNSDFNENRLVLLQLILTLFSANLYQPNQGQGYLNPFIAYFNSPQSQLLEFFFISIFGIAVKHKESGILPYQGNSNGNQIKRDLGLVASQIIFIMMTEYGNSWQLANQTIEQNISLQAIYNEYIQNFKDPQKLGRERVLQSIFSSGVSIIVQESIGLSEDEQQDQQQGDLLYMENLISKLLNLLENPINFSQQYIKDSIGKIRYTEEILGILYIYSSSNNDFFQAICNKEEHLKKLFKVVMYQFCDSLENQTGINPFFICIAILIHFSRDKNFCSLLSQQLEFNFPQLKYFPIVGGTNGDFLVTCVAQSIINGHINKQNCYAYNQLALLVNVSYYLTNLSAVSSNKLVQLLSIFTTYNYLLQDYYRPLCLVKILIIFDCILQKDPNSNTNLILELYKGHRYVYRALRLQLDEDSILAFLGDKMAMEKLLAKNHNEKQKIIKNSPEYQKQIQQQQQESKKIVNMREKFENKNNSEQYSTQNSNGNEMNVSEEDKQRIVEYWKQFNWQEFRKQMPQKNILIIIQRIQQQLNENKANNKTQLVDLQFIENIANLDNNSKDQNNANRQSFKDIIIPSKEEIVVENFDQNPQIAQIFRSFCWTNIYSKTTGYTKYEYSKLLYFQIKNQEQLQELQEQIGLKNNNNNKQQQQQQNNSNISLEVNHPSESDLKYLQQQQQQNQQNTNGQNNQQAGVENQQQQQQQQQQLQLQLNQENGLQQNNKNEQQQRQQQEEEEEDYDDDNDEQQEEGEEEEEKDGKSTPQKPKKNKKQKVVGERNNSNHPNNLYIISEADSKKEETMMFQQQQILNTIGDRDEDKLRNKSLSSARAVQKYSQSLTKNDQDSYHDILKKEQEMDRQIHEQQKEEDEDDGLQQQQKLQNKKLDFNEQQENRSSDQKEDYKIVVDEIYKTQAHDEEEDEEIQQKQNISSGDKSQELTNSADMKIDKIMKNFAQNNEQDFVTSPNNQQDNNNNNQGNQISFTQKADNLDNNQKQENNSNDNNDQIDIDIDIDEEQNKINAQIALEKQNYEIQKQNNEQKVQNELQNFEEHVVIQDDNNNNEQEEEEEELGEQQQQQQSYQDHQKKQDNNENSLQQQNSVQQQQIQEDENSNSNNNKNLIDENENGDEDQQQQSNKIKKRQRNRKKKQ